MPESRFDFNRFALYGNKNISNWIIEPLLEYNRKIGDGKFDMLMGGTIQHNFNNIQTVLGRGYNKSDASF